MSNKPVLYYAPRSPPCRAVQLTAAALGVELDLRLMNLKERDHLTPEFLKLNPLHTIPVLDDNGVIITDSHVICGYLADKYATDETLYPKAGQQRREVDTRLYFEAGHLFPRVRLMVEPVLYFGVAEITNDRIEYMQKAYDNLEYCLANTEYLCGAHLTIADLSCISSVSSAIPFAPIDADRFPKLSAWVQRISELPYYQKNNQDGADLLEGYVKELLEKNKKQTNGATEAAQTA